MTTANPMSEMLTQATTKTVASKELQTTLTQLASRVKSLYSPLA